MKLIGIITRSLQADMQAELRASQEHSFGGEVVPSGTAASAISRRMLRPVRAAFFHARKGKAYGHHGPRTLIGRTG
jgi:hypothetical protein